MSNSKDEQLVVIHIASGEEKSEVKVYDTRVSKPTGVHDKEDNEITYFQKLINTEINGVKISIAAPNEISLSLNRSSKAYIKAEKLRKAIKLNAKKAGGALYEQDVISAYDYLEEIQTSIIFAYKAVESFCNAIIPNDYEYRVKNAKGITELYNKEQIERWLSTSDKISKILPEITKTTSPTQCNFWSEFRNLERLRNEIIHSKSNASASVLSELFSVKIDKYIKSCISLLNHFIKVDPSNPIFPIGLGSSTIRVISVEDVSKIFEVVK